MGEGADENDSEFQVQIKPMSSLMPVTYTAVTIPVSLVTILIKSLPKCIPSTALLIAINRMWLHYYYCTAVIQL